MGASESKERDIRLDAPEQTRDGWHFRKGLEFHEVEDLLDYLEACGISRREVELNREEEGFTVRWSK